MPSDYLDRPLLDMDELDSETSEYGWGSGLVPPGLETASPSEGGMYRGTSPPCEPSLGVSRR